MGPARFSPMRLAPKNGKLLPARSVRGAHCCVFGRTRMGRILAFDSRPGHAGPKFLRATKFQQSVLDRLMGRHRGPVGEFIVRQRCSSGAPLIVSNHEPGFFSITEALQT